MHWLTSTTVNSRFEPVRALRAIIAAAVFVCPMAAEAAVLQGSDALTFAAADSGRRIASPGERMTIAFIAINNTSRSLTAVRSTELPENWRMLAGGSRLTLAAKSREVLLVSFAVPESARPGSHSVVVRLAADGATYVAVAALHVRERRELHLSVLSAPEVVAAGDRYSITYEITNRGNVTTQVRIDATASAAASVTLTSSALHLSPGESRTIQALVRTSDERAVGTPQRISLRATAEHETASEAPSPLTSTTLVDVVPRATVGQLPAYSIPFAFTARSVQSGNDWSAQSGSDRRHSFELTGAGPLAPGSSTRVAVRARTAGPQATGFVDDRDEYRFAITGKRFDARLGDALYALTPLTQPGRYAFGAGGRAAAGRLTIGGFSSRNRHIDAAPRETAGFATVRVAGSSALTVNHLERDGPGSASVSSLRAQLPLPMRSTADIEYAVGSDAQSRGSAWSGHLAGRLGRVTYDLRHRHTDPAFAGVLRPGVDDTYGRVSLNPWRRLWVRTSLHERTSDPHFLSLTNLQPGHHLTVHTTAAGYGAFGLEREVTSNERDHPQATMASQALVRLRLGARRGPLHLSGTVEEGGLQATGHIGDNRFWKIGGASTLAFRHGSYSLYGDRVSGRTIYSGDVHQRLQGGAQAIVHAGSSTQLRLAANGYRSDGLERHSYGLLDASVAQQIHFGHTLALRVRNSVAGRSGFERNIFEVSYRIPFGVSLRRASRMGRIQARLYDAETGIPVADALVRLGSSLVLTDKGGRATFGSVDPDSPHLIQLDRRGASGDRIPATDQPLEVRVSAGRTVSLDIPLTPGGRVEGRIVRYAPAEPSALAEDVESAMIEVDSVPRLVVQLSNGIQQRRRATDTHGTFEFSDVQPGLWTIQVVNGGLPEHHVMADSSIAVLVAGSDTVRTVMRMVPRQRRIRMIGGGTVAADVVVALRTPLRTHSGQISPSPSFASRGSESRALLPGVPDASAHDRWRNSDPHYRRPAFTPPTQADLDALRVQDEARATVRAAPAVTASATLPNIFVSTTGRTWYRIGPQDRSLKGVARAVYGDAGLWPKIWVTNRHSVADPDDLSRNRRLLIPAKAPLTEEENHARNEYVRLQKCASYTVSLMPQ